MLGKLLKYEFKSTARKLLPLYGAAIVLAFISRIANPADTGNWGLSNGILMATYSGVLVASFVLTFLLMIQRFNQNLLGDEGYLMFTLPVSTSANLLTKLIASVVWLAASFLTALLTVYIIWGKQIPFYVLRSLPGLVEDFWLLFFELAFLALIFAAFGTLVLYTSISIGHLFQKNRFLWSVGAFFALSILLQAVFSVVGEHLEAMDYLANIQSNHLAVNLLSLLLLALSVLLFFAARYILRNRLNLE